MGHCLITLLRGTVSCRYAGRVPRWEPGTRDRLERAAVTLFAERGYDTVTVEQIAAAAGLARSGFFRYFRDKSDVLSSDHDAFVDRFADGVRGAPDDAGAVAAIEAGLVGLEDAWFTEDVRDLAPLRAAAIASSPDLQERELLKHRDTAEAVASALRSRGEPTIVAEVAGQLALLAFRRTVAAWSDPHAGAFGALARRTVRQVVDAAGDLR